MSGDEKEPMRHPFSDRNLEWKRLHPLNSPEGEALDEHALEKKWAEEQEPETPAARRWSLIWFGALAVGVVAATITVAVRSSRETEATAPELAYITAAERKALAKQTLVEFFSAGSTAERLDHILDPARLEKPLGEYYGRPGLTPLTLGRVVGIELVDFSDQPWIWISFLDKESAAHVAALKQVDGVFKLDWESLVAYGEMSWDRFFAERPESPTQMRVYLLHSSYHNYKYSDPKKYASFQIESRGTTHTLYGYVERGTPVYREVGSSVVPGSRQPVNLWMHFEPDAGGRNLVIIDALVHNLWVSPVIIGSQG